MNAKKSRTLALVSLVVRVAVVMAIVGAGVGIFMTLKAMKVEPKRTESSNRGILVSTITTTDVLVPRIWEGYGSVRAMDASTISAQILARVVERPEGIEAGMPIGDGAVIVRLDTSDSISKVQAAEANVASFSAQLESLDAQEFRLQEQVQFAEQEREIERRNFERVKKAVENNAGTESDVDSALSAMSRTQRTLATLQQQIEVLVPRRSELLAMQSNARASLDLAQEDLDRATILSPLAGTLQDVYVEVGELVSVGQQIARVVDLRRLEIPLRIPISAVSTIRMGDRVVLRADGPTLNTWEGSISRIAPEADASSRTMTVFVEVEQDPTAAGVGDAMLLPGQFVIGRVFTSDETRRILVPRRAVSGDRVLVVSTDKTGSRALPVDIVVSHYIHAEMSEIDATETEWAVIERGLEVGQYVITSNLDVIVGGMRLIREGDAQIDDAPPAAEGGGS